LIAKWLLIDKIIYIDAFYTSFLHCWHEKNQPPENLGENERGKLALSWSKREILRRVCHAGQASLEVAENGGVFRSQISPV
jgi:hypothetical protein